MFQIYGCPMHYGVGDRGLIQSVDYFKEYCRDLDFEVIPEITMPEEGLQNLKNLNSVVATCEKIAEKGYSILQDGEKPLFIAGDHSAVMGSISASGTYYNDLGLVWIDAHPDINTDATTVTGNIHGMPVAALLGMGEKRLTRILSPKNKLLPEHIVMLGLRDIDPPEAEFLEKLQIKYYTYDRMMELGIDRCLEESIAYLSGLAHIHISFDIDVMDPAKLPGVSVPVPEGFQEPEAFQIMGALMGQLPVVSCDIVEFNKEHDADDRTAAFAKKLMEFILRY